MVFTLVCLVLPQLLASLPIIGKLVVNRGVPRVLVPMVSIDLTAITLTVNWALNSVKILARIFGLERGKIEDVALVVIVLTAVVTVTIADLRRMVLDLVLRV